jgi:hypothetical protein
MSLTLNSNDARKADNFNSVIRESGKYVGTITRAEKLLSRNNVEGVGFSFKTDDNASANYLDLYTVKPGGEKLRGYSIVQAILCCTRTKTADDGKITFEKWDSDERRMVQATADGYPALMGKHIGLVLQREIGTNQNTGEDTDRLNIVAVFEPSTGLMASEILDQKTKGERLDNIVKMIEANPVRDTRKRSAGRPPAASAPQAGNNGSTFDDDIPF